MTEAELNLGGGIPSPDRMKAWGGGWTQSALGPPSLQRVSHKCPSPDRDPVTSGLLRLTTESQGEGRAQEEAWFGC